MQADRLSEARWQAYLRPALFGVYLEHESRGESAGTSDAERSVGAGQYQLQNVCRTREALLPGRGLRVREGRRRHRAHRDQCADLRARQDLRFQGPDAEYRVVHARRRRRAELSEYVTE